jgi:hypothetical protein
MLTRDRILSSYGTARKQLLLSGSHFAVFSQDMHPDLVIVGRCQPQKKSSLYAESILTKTPSSDCDLLWSKVEELSIARAVTSFSLTPLVLQSLKKAIKDLSATHLRFYNEGNILRIVVFDYVKFHSEYRLPRKNSQTIRYHETSVVVHNDFSITMLAKSFEMLPSEYLDLRIGENGVCQVDFAKNNLKYLMRDQKLIEPMTVFHSPQISRDIAFVFHPKSSSADPHTIQSLS